MSWERLLAEDKTLEKSPATKLTYPGRCTRLHELGALQTRWTGGSAPLGRMDVQGLPEK